MELQRSLAEAEEVLLAEKDNKNKLLSDEVTKTISQKSSRNGPGSQSQNYNKVKERSF